MQREAATEDGIEVFSSVRIISSAIILLQSDMMRASLSGRASLLRQFTEMSIIRYFTSVMMVERDLELYDKNLAIAGKNLEIMKLRADMGAIPKNMYESAKLSYEKDLIGREDKQGAIDDAYRALNIVMGTTVSNKYKLILNIEYEKLKDRNLNTHINDFLIRSIAVADRERDLESAEINLRTSSAAYKVEELKVAVEQARRAIGDTKKNIEEKIISCYNDIKEFELAIGVSEADLANMRRQLGIKMTQFELGKTTRLDIETFEYQVLIQEFMIMTRVFEHHVKVMQFENPELL